MQKKSQRSAGPLQPKNDSNINSCTSKLPQQQSSNDQIMASADAMDQDHEVLRAELQSLKSVVHNHGRQQSQLTEQVCLPLHFAQNQHHAVRSRTAAAVQSACTMYCIS